MRAFQRNRRRNIRFATDEVIRINDLLSGKKPAYLTNLKDAFGQAEYYLQYNDWAAQKAQVIINRHVSAVLTLRNYLDKIDDKQYAQELIKQHQSEIEKWKQIKRLEEEVAHKAVTTATRAKRIG